MHELKLDGEVPVEIPRAPAVPSGTYPPSAELPLDEEAGALSLIDRHQTSEAQIDLAAEMLDRYELGDFTGALRVAELVLGQEPEHGEALRCAESSRAHLVKFYTSRVGSTEHVLEVCLPDQVRWLGIDHRAGFLLSRIDGHHTVDEVLDMSGMQRLEGLKTLVELLDAKTIRTRGPTG